MLRRNLRNQKRNGMSLKTDHMWKITTTKRYFSRTPYISIELNSRFHPFMKVKTNIFSHLWDCREIQREQRIYPFGAATKQLISKLVLSTCSFYHCVTIVKIISNGRRLLFSKESESKSEMIGTPKIVFTHCFDIQ